jgi:hypothetical protein
MSLRPGMSQVQRINIHVGRCGYMCYKKTKTHSPHVSFCGFSPAWFSGRKRSSQGPLCRRQQEIRSTLSLKQSIYTCIPPLSDDKSGIIKQADREALVSENVFKSLESTRQYLTIFLEISETIAKATPTAFHRMMNDMVKRRDSVRIYTQNTDELEVRCPWLSEESPPSTNDPFSNVVAVHGSINKAGRR